MCFRDFCARSISYKSPFSEIFTSHLPVLGYFGQLELLQLKVPVSIHPQATKPSILSAFFTFIKNSSAVYTLLFISHQTFQHLKSIMEPPKSLNSEFVVPTTIYTFIPYSLTLVQRLRLPNPILHPCDPTAPAIVLVDLLSFY